MENHANDAAAAAAAAGGGGGGPAAAAATATAKHQGAWARHAQGIGCVDCSSI